MSEATLSRLPTDTDDCRHFRNAVTCAASVPAAANAGAVWPLARPDGLAAGRAG